VETNKPAFKYAPKKQDGSISNAPVSTHGAHSSHGKDKPHENKRVPADVKKGQLLSKSS